MSAESALVVCDAASAAAGGAYAGDQWADAAAPAPRIVFRGAAAGAPVGAAAGAAAGAPTGTAALRRAADEYAAAVALDRRIMAALAPPP
jgi:hypothetical protein